MRRRHALRAAYVLTAAADAALAGRPEPAAHRARQLTKPALVPLLAAADLLDPLGPPSTTGRAVLVAQAASWAGDVALLAPGDDALRRGLACFGVAHLAYGTGWLTSRRRPAAVPDRRAVPPAPDAGSRPPRAALRLLGRAATRTAGTTARTALDPRPRLAVLAAANAAALSLAARRRDPALGAPVAAYGLLLGAAAVAAMSAGGSRSGRLLTALGATTFAVSDTVLGVRELVWRDSPTSLETVVMVSYTGAQLMLAEGAARL